MRLSSFARPMDTYVVIKPCVYVKPSQQHILRHLNNSNKHGLVQVSENVCFPVKRQTERPTWNCCRRVLLPELSRQFKIGMDTVLFFQVFAKSNLMGDQEIARARVPLKDIRQDEKLMSIPLVLKSPSEGERVAMILQRARVPPRHKTVFFIRHGESIWNEAQRDMDLGTMFSQTDHGLNEVGLMQALALQHKIQVASEADDVGMMKALAPTTRHQKFLSAFLNSDSLLSSPLTRALQTAMVALALHPHTIRSKRPNVLTLVADAREKRNLGGRDTQGQALGQEIIDRALNELQRQFKNTPQKEVPEEIKRVGININDCTQIWWNSNAESADAFNERLDNLAKHLGFMRSTSIVVTSHSHFIRAFFKRFICKEGAGSQPELSESLQRDLLCNGGVIGLDLEFTSAGIPRIMDFCLLFDTKIKTKKTKSPKSSQLDGPSKQHQRSKSAYRIVDNFKLSMSNIDRVQSSSRSRNSNGKASDSGVTTKTSIPNTPQSPPPPPPPHREASKLISSQGSRSQLNRAGGGAVGKESKGEETDGLSPSEARARKGSSILDL
mmetsp:Transcript_31403/g.44007  ORF Transcript_31403/g.44007 Transcript_31403/m.44007 type:complete len:554 (+) Transcript_31403:142-1803(+)